MRISRVWLGPIVSVVAVAILILTVDIRQVAQHLAGVNLLYALAFVGLQLASLIVRAARWRLLFPEALRMSRRGPLVALCIGYMTNTVIPFRAGELVRIILISEREQVRRSTAFGTVMVEKVLDLLAMALLFFALRFVMPLPTSADTAAWFSGLGLVLGVLGLVAALMARVPALRLAAYLEQRARLLARLRIGRILEELLDGLSWAQHPGVLARVAGLTVVLWTVTALMFYVGARSVGAGIDPGMAVVTLVATNLTMVVPSAPGYVGIFHAAVVGTLAAFGIEEGRALAAAVVIHALSIATVIVLSSYFLVRGDVKLPAGLSLRDVLNRRRLVESTGRTAVSVAPVRSTSQPGVTGPHV